MRIILLSVASVVAIVGAIATFDWEDRSAEFLRWCFAALAVISAALFLSGCAELSAIRHACQSGLCR